MPNGNGRAMAMTRGTEIETKTSGGDLRLEFIDDLVRYAYARLGSIEEAEDVAIEVLHDVSQRAGGLAGLREPKIYLLGMARRKVALHFRNTQKQRGSHTISLGDISEIATSGVETDESVAVGEVLAKLPDLYQEVLVLKYVHGLSADEIAQVIRKSNRAARGLIQRAREAFAKEGAHLV